MERGREVASPWNIFRERKSNSILNRRLYSASCHAVANRFIFLYGLMRHHRSFSMYRSRSSAFEQYPASATMTPLISLFALRKSFRSSVFAGENTNERI